MTFQSKSMFEYLRVKSIKSIVISKSIAFLFPDCFLSEEGFEEKASDYFEGGISEDFSSFHSTGYFKNHSSNELDDMSTFPVEVRFSGQ